LQDRIKNFDLSRAPLLRFYFINLADQESYLLWSHHHIIMDGWCAPLLMHTVKSAYDSLRKKQVVTTFQNRPYKYYIDWLALQNRSEAENFWKNYLHGIDQPTKINLPKTNNIEDDKFGIINRSLTVEETKKLYQYAKSKKVTVNTVFQLAWSIILSKYIQRTDFVYGVVVSGRGINLDGVDKMIGLFIHTLPLRVVIKDNQSIESLMQTIQKDMVSIQRYGYLSIAEIQAISECKSSNPLFDNLISFVNYPHKSEIDHKTLGGYNYEVVELIEKTEYPLCIAVIPKEEFTLRFTFNCKSFSHEQAAQVMNHLYTFIRNII
jgi:microcystin synthetase protein McyB